MNEPTIFLGTPLATSFVHTEWVAGALSLGQAFPGRYRVETSLGSFLPRQRDILVRKFFDSGCSHLLCVDSDIGWRASDVQKLLATGKDFVSGVYCQKTEERKLPFQFDGEVDGPLLGCDWAPGGFLLVKRAVIERMMGAYCGLQYDSGGHGRLVALWSMMFDPETPYSSEDVAFCKRWRRLGGEIWAHSGVQLKHFGERAYVPDMTAHGAP